MHNHVLSRQPRRMIGLAAVLTLIFLTSGAAKLLALDYETAAFTRWGYPLWFMYLTGGLEAAGAVGLWVRPLRGFAAVGLAGVMLGAAGTHLVNAEWPMLIVALAICAGCGALAWQRRDEMLSQLRHYPRMP